MLVQTLSKTRRFQASDLLVLHGVTDDRHVLDSLGPVATLIEVERDHEIVAQGDPARYCYQVMSGCVRTVKLLEDGRRQIGDFLLPGDVLGWETLDHYEFGAEAVTHARLRRFRRATLEERADHDRLFAQRLRQYVAGRMRAMRGHMVLLGRLSASERVANFLLQMSDRLRAEDDGTSQVIELPMSRTDMADYLGLTIETVCRGLAELRRQGTIAVKRAQISIEDRNALGLAGSDQVH